MRLLKGGALLAAVSLLAAGMPATAATTPGGAAKPAGQAPVRQHTITLITGDVVHATELAGGQIVADVERPRGATGRIRTRTIGKDFYVFPDEVAPYLAAGTIDRRLFDITELISLGYTDAARGGIPLIVSYKDTRTRGVRPTPAGAEKVRDLNSIGAVAMKADKKQAKSFWKDVAAPSARTLSAAPTGTFDDGIAKIWLDGRVKVTMAESNAQIGSASAWNAGLTGKGVKVAVLDTGYDATHPDLAGRVSQAQSFVPGESPDRDPNGHGTHVASTVGGSGAASSGAEKGVAPDADLLVGKVLSDAGWGDDSWIIAGMEWAVAQGAKVVSMSLGGDPTDGTDPMSQAVNRLTAQSGTLFVIAAGNAGGQQTVSTPSAADAALTIGAVDADDYMAYFSSRGPRVGDHALKPDMTAPGVAILAARAAQTEGEGSYQRMSGTSMATPHVAGAAAILAQQHPDWTAEQLKDALVSTSKGLDIPVDEGGTGRLDLALTMAAKVTATSSAYFGFFMWPPDDDAPVSKTVTYTNTGDSAVTLKLTEETKGAQGEEVPADLFSSNVDTVTVPAHGTATVTATGDPRLAGFNTRFTGFLVASDEQGNVLARTRLGLEKEEERYSLTVKAIGRDGAPTGGEVDVFWFETTASGGWWDPIVWPVPLDPTTGQVTMRLKPGNYSAMMFLFGQGKTTDSTSVTFGGDPQIKLDRDRTVVVDARKGREIRAITPQETEDRFVRLDYLRTNATGLAVINGLVGGATDDAYYAIPTAPVTIGEFELNTRWRKAAPTLTVRNGQSEVPARTLPGSVWKDLNSTVDAVYVGAGRAEDYAGKDVRGKAVLLTKVDDYGDPENPWDDDDASARVQLAAEAGATAVFIVNNQPGQTMLWVGGDKWSAVPVAGLTAKIGEPLVAQAIAGKLRLNLRGIANTPYIYDLTSPHAGAIPADLTYRADHKKLAKLDVRYHSDRPTDGSEFRWDLRPWMPHGIGYPQRADFPVARTEWISGGDGTRWHHSNVILPEMQEQRSDLDTYAAGKSYAEKWFGPVIRPRLGLGAWQPTRRPGYMQINITPWTDGGAGHAGFLEGQQCRLRVYADGVLIDDTGTSPWGASTNPDVDDSKTSRYRFELDAARDGNRWPTSIRSHSVWDFTSAPVTDWERSTRMPLLQLDYDVKHDLSGDVRTLAGWQVLGFSASHMPGVTGAGKVKGSTLQVSYDDGATWQPVTLIPAGNGKWAALLHHPEGAEFVSLKASAWDDAGNKVEQEIVRAYRMNDVFSH